MAGDKPTEDRRRQGKAAYGALFAEVAAILCDLDPIGIARDGGHKEYDQEVSAILPQLRTCGTAGDVRQVILAVFVEAFDLTSGTDDPVWRQASERVWLAWQGGSLSD